MFNFHTHQIDSVPCLLSCSPDDVERLHLPDGVHLSVGLHPWQVTAEGWEAQVARVRMAARNECVWAVGECGLDKVQGVDLQTQMEAFRAQIAVAEEVKKPMVIHCVRAFDELLALRKEWERKVASSSTSGLANEGLQPWVIHGFRGKPQQIKQLMAKGLLFSFGHQYHVEALRFAFTSSRPFFLETDDSRLSVRQIYEQVARHLDVDVALLDRLCDPRHSLFSLR